MTVQADRKARLEQIKLRLLRGVDNEADMRWLVAELEAVTARETRAVEALLGLDDSIAWLRENYPAAFEAMPQHLYEQIGKAAALAGDSVGGAR